VLLRYNSILGTPAGMMTTSAPVRAAFFASSVSCCSPLKSPFAATKPLISYNQSAPMSAAILFVFLLTAFDEMWDRSAATPGVFTTSKRARSSMRVEILQRSERGYSCQLLHCFKCIDDIYTWPMPPDAPRTTALTILTACCID
jgi:hypothetical protein